MEIKDITPKDLPIISARDKILTPDPIQEIAPQIGGLGSDLASTVSDAINGAGNFVKDVINARFNTQVKQILDEFTFASSGAIKISTDEDNGLWISPTGILAKKAGVNTLTITNSGDATFAGTLAALGGTFGAITGGTVTLSNTGFIRGGQTAYNTGVGFWLGYDSGGSPAYKFSLGDPAGDYLYWDGSHLTLNGSTSLVGTLPWSSITDDGHKPSDDATVGADWNADLLNIPSTLQTPSASGLYLSGNYLGFYNGAAWNAYIDNSGNFYFKGDANSSIDWNITTASTLTVKGKIVAGTGSSIAVSYLSGTIPQANLNVADRGWSQTSAFSVTDADTIAWGGGTFTSADGTTYIIVAGNTGNMTAKTYIYLDIAVSIIAYQTTTIATTAVGAGKVLIATAQNGTNEAIYFVFNGQGGQNIDGTNIVLKSLTAAELADLTVTGAKIAAATITAAKITAGTITSNEIAAGTIIASNIHAGTITSNEIAASTITANNIAATTITAGKMSITSLSSIVANLGSITAGNITLDSSGYIKGGQTAYNTGIGFYLGYSTDAYKFSIGNTTDYLTWDGSALTASFSKIVTPFTAGMAITTGQTVFIYTDGKVYSTDALSSYQTTRYLGIALENISKNAVGKIQTFGNITGLTGLTIASIYYLADATHVADQSFWFGTFSQGATGDWQSFTTGVGIVELSAVRIALYGPNNGTVTVSIREGEGTGGTLIGSGTVPYTTANFSGPYGSAFCSLNVPITVSASTKYTMVVSISGGSKWGAEPTGGYAGGISGAGGNTDYLFETYYSGNRGLVATTAGTNSKKIGIATSTTKITVKDSL